MSLKNEFIKLLDKEEKEEVYQRFLENHTKLIPTGAFGLNHGIHMSLIFSKMPIGNIYKSDFFLISKSSAEWNLVFIELEKPSANLFTKEGRYAQDLNQGIKQINDWKHYFSQPENQLSFKKHPVVKKLLSFNEVMYENPINFKYIIVIGRRKTLIERNQMKYWISLNNGKADTYIMTYDSLLEGCEQKNDRYIGHVEKEFLCIDSESMIHGDTQFGINLLSTTDCKGIKIKQSLYNEIIKYKNDNDIVLGYNKILGKDYEKKIKILKENIYNKK